MHWKETISRRVLALVSAKSSSLLATSLVHEGCSLPMSPPLDAAWTVLSSVIWSTYKKQTFQDGGRSGLVELGCSFLCALFKSEHSLHSHIHSQSKMLKSKTFVKKTRKGGIVKVVREHYLRDDVWCGAQHCTTCEHEADRIPFLMDSRPLMPSKLCTYPHFIIPDTNVVLHQVSCHDNLMRARKFNSASFTNRYCTTI